MQSEVARPVKSRKVKAAAEQRGGTYPALRDLLKSELVHRTQKNPRYSLRAYAKSLGLSPAFVSKLLNGERPFTRRTLDILAEQIPLHPEQVAYYAATVRAARATGASSQAQDYRQMSLDEFQMISDWYHFAILELTTTVNFNPDPRAIARQLQITTLQASDALERLIRLGRLKKSGDGNLHLADPNNSIVGPEIAVPATRNQQTQILEMAVRHLSETPIEKRSQTAMTMAIKASRLGEAKALIHEFRRRITDLLQQNEDDRDAVYQLSISFFPLTRE